MSAPATQHPGRGGHLAVRGAVRPHVVPPGDGGQPLPAPGHRRPGAHRADRGPPGRHLRRQGPSAGGQPHLAGGHHRSLGVRQADQEGPGQPGITGRHRAHRLRGAHQGGRHRADPGRQAVQPAPAHPHRRRRARRRRALLLRAGRRVPVGGGASANRCGPIRTGRWRPTCSATWVASPVRRSRPSRAASCPPTRWPSRTNPTARSARPGSRPPTRTSCGARPASRRSRWTRPTTRCACSAPPSPSPATTWC